MQRPADISLKSTEVQCRLVALYLSDWPVLIDDAQQAVAAVSHFMHRIVTFRIRTFSAHPQILVCISPIYILQLTLYRHTTEMYSLGSLREQSRAGWRVFASGCRNHFQNCITKWQAIRTSSYGFHLLANSLLLPIPQTNVNESSLFGFCLRYD